MSSARRTRARTDRDTARKPKNRQCLMCGDTFASKWAGERVCPRCKGTSAWREGAISDFSSAGGKR